MHNQFLICCVILCSGAGAAGEQPTDGRSDEDLLNKIRAEFKDRSFGIRTLRVRFRRMPPLDRDGKYRSDVEPKQFEWLLSANKERLTQEPWKDTRREVQSDSLNLKLPPSPEWDSFDGTVGYHVNYWPSSPETMASIFRTKFSPEAIRNNWLPVYLGIRIPYLPLPFDDLLENRETAVVGHEKVGDVECTHVRLASYEVKTGLKHDLDAWLDDDHGFAVRRLRLNPSRLRSHAAGLVQFEPGEAAIHIEAAALISADDPLARKKRWFPASWIVGPGRLPHTVIDAITINGNVDPTEFTPVPTDGTEIMDNTRVESGTQTFIAGGEEGIAIRKKYLKQNTLESLLQTTPTEPKSIGKMTEWDARSPMGNSLPNLIWAVALTCLIASAAITIRRRRS